MGEDREELQFEKADFGGTGATRTSCGGCGRELWDSYYEVNGKLACERCKTDLELMRGQGSGAGRFFRASIYGLGAGLVGAGIWYGIRAATGFEIGFIAIVVGLLVGGAVRKGSNGRGGPLYQALAIFLTYGSIVSTYVPMIVGELRDKWGHAAKAEASPVPNGSPTADPAASETPAPGAAAVPSKPVPSLARALLALAILTMLIFAIAFAAPFLMGFQNVIGLFIIGIGLYEAWKINRRVPLTIAGPYRVGAQAPLVTPES